MLRDLEDVVVFPVRLSRVLFQLFENGREPILDDAPTITPDVLKTELQRGVNSWEHLHSAKAVAGFLAWLRTAPTGE